MKPFFALFVLSTAVIAGDTFDDMLLRDGTVLKNVEVTEITGRGLKVTHKDGSGLIKTEQLPAEVKKRYAARIAAAAGAAPAESSPPETKPGNPRAAGAGFEPAAVVQLCEKTGLTTRTSAGKAGNEWAGTLKDETAEIKVIAIGPDANSVSAITATVISTGGTNGSARARTVFSSLAAVPYAGADAAKAKQWIGDHIDADDAKTIIGGVTFHVSTPARTPNARVLRIAIP